MDNYKIGSKNIRATSFKEFWGDKYKDDLYLWEGAKHNMTLTDISQCTTETLIDDFKSHEQITKVTEECRKLYLEILPLVVKRLNIYHNENLSLKFWQIAFGYWFYRHVCIVFEKYNYLSKLDIDSTDIKLLRTESFFIPFDHFEYINIFSSDFGVQQLVTQYYNLFSAREFLEITMEVDFNRSNDSSLKSYQNKKKIDTWVGNVMYPKQSLIKSILVLKKEFLKLIKPKVVLLKALYTAKFIKELTRKSYGRIRQIDLPNVLYESINSADIANRENIFQIDTTNNFEKYLFNTLIYCLPSIFLEQFERTYSVFTKDIINRKFKYIISEGWIGHSDISLYFAAAYENKKLLVFQEHAAGRSLTKNSTLWIDTILAEPFLTTGWISNEKNVYQGGFLARDIIPYIFNSNKSNILFISHIRYPYLMEFSSHASNSNYLSELKWVREFFIQMPKNLRDNFSFRPRKAKYFWDTEFTLELKSNQIKIDEGNFSENIMNSRIIIIDHISTGLAELILMGVPFLLLLTPHYEITEDYTGDFNRLIEEGIVHTNPASAINKLNEVYENVENWWKSESVSRTLYNFQKSFLAKPEKTKDFLLEMLKN